MGVAVWCLVSACGVSGKKKAAAGTSGASINTTCAFIPGQENSIQGKWTTPPIKVSFHAGDFTADEINAVQAGGKTWNDFFTASKSFSIFDMGPAGAGNVSSAVQNTPTCSGKTISDGTVLYKRFSNWTKSTAAIAVTTTCFTPQNTGYATIYNAIMEFNYVNFFQASSNRFPDIQSIALHELGHLLGLDHSCGTLGRPNQNKTFLNCPDVNADPNNPIISTVMYPQVFFDQTGAGEVKQVLTDNDQSRANCVYGN